MAVELDRMLRRALLLALAAAVAARAPGPMGEQARSDPSVAQDFKMPIDDEANVRLSAPSELVGGGLGWAAAQPCFRGWAGLGAATARLPFAHHTALLPTEAMG